MTSCWSFQRTLALEFPVLPIISASFSNLDNNVVTLTVKISKTYGDVQKIELVNSFDDTTTYFGYETTYWTVLDELDDCYSYYQGGFPWGEFYFAWKGGILLHKKF